jgi:hypothetical protein
VRDVIRKYVLVGNDSIGDSKINELQISIFDAYFNYIGVRGLTLASNHIIGGKTMNTTDYTGRKGSVITLVLLTAVILLVLGMGLLSLGLRSRFFAVKRSSKIAARCAADAGLAQAIYEMNQKFETKPWDDSTLPSAANAVLPNCDATYSYEIVKNPQGNYAVISVGKMGQEISTITCVLKIQSPFDYAMFGSRYLWLKAGTTIDGYNYDSPNELLKVGVNSTEAGAIFARMGVLIDGDVFVGPGGDPSIVIDAQNEVVITGEFFTLNEVHPMDPVPFPSHLAALPSLGIIDGSMTLTGNTRCEEIDLTGGAVLTIDGPVSLYVVGETWLDNGAQIKIVDANTNPDAYLNLYLGNKFTVQNGGFLNNFTKDTSKLTIYGLTDCINFSFLTDSVLYGAVYAPYANFNIFNKVEIFGSVIVERLAQQVDSDFHYDASLKAGRVTDELVTFTVGRWSE